MDKGPNNKGQHEEARLKRKLILEEKRRKRMAFSQRNEQILLRAHHDIENHMSIETNSMKADRECSLRALHSTPLTDISSAILNKANDSVVTPDITSSSKSNRWSQPSNQVKHVQRNAVDINLLGVNLFTKFSKFNDNINNIVDAENSTMERKKRPQQRKTTSSVKQSLMSDTHLIRETHVCDQEPQIPETSHCHPVDDDDSSSDEEYGLQDELWHVDDDDSSSNEDFVLEEDLGHDMALSSTDDDSSSYEEYVIEDDLGRDIGTSNTSM
ncbi:uncharacterized protein LOC130747740 [Lotus japonicus]|uniref:uncharacterized protein LOC130747740 n=2 Tax=Lotus japonicus TaxID=34305 RepID=UPI0025904ECA|nr:uncharacterized protein LOC130747740 [Lotus japonicus]